MDPKLKELITAVGVLAEMVRLLRDELLKNGFTRSEAIQMTQAVLVEQFKTKPKEDN